jgi:hypothetical protein
MSASVGITLVGFDRVLPDERAPLLRHAFPVHLGGPLDEHLLRAIIEAKKRDLAVLVYHRA